MVTPTAKRAAVDHLKDAYEVSLRRACGLMNMNTSSYYYRVKPCDDNEQRAALKTAAHKRKRWGYRMLGEVLRRDGFTDNHKRIYRAMASRL